MLGFKKFKQKLELKATAKTQDGKITLEDVAHILFPNDYVFVSDLPFPMKALAAHFGAGLDIFGDDQKMVAEFNHIRPQMVTNMIAQDPVVTIPTANGRVIANFRELVPFMTRNPDQQYAPSVEIAGRIVGLNTSTVAELAPKIRKKIFPLVVQFEKPQPSSWLNFTRS